MAVHTKLSRNDILEILKKYNLGNLEKFSGIKEGIENTNYFIITSKNKFVLTIYENRVNKSKLPMFLKLMIHSSAQKIKCPNPIKDKNKGLINITKSKKFGIFSFLDGKSKKNWVDFDCLLVGNDLANFHKKNMKIKLDIDNSYGVSSWEKLFNKCKFKIEKIIPNSTNTINISIRLNKNNSATIPNIPPTIIIKTKVLGMVQMALPPICELIIPTLTIAKK